MNKQTIYRNNRKTRKEIADFTRRLYIRGLTTSLGGNISVRVGEDVLCITPSAKDKAWLSIKDMCVISFYGENKKVSNTKSKSELGLDYDWPNYRLAFDAMWKNSNWK